MNEIKCKLCSGKYLSVADKNVEDFEYKSPGKYTYYSCNKCGLFNIAPIPDEATLNLAYPVTYHAYQQHSTKLARLLKKRYWRSKANRLSKILNKDSAVLDIGCSSGDFLVELKNLGYKHLFGIDFSASAVKIANDKGIDVAQGDFDKFDFKGKSFDVIVMTNFLEHVYDPVKTMRKCADILKPRGIVIGETPNTSAWDYKLSRRFWGGYHTPRHLYLFNKSSLHNLAQQTGFTFEGIQNMVQPAHWALSVQNAIQGSKWKMNLNNGRSWLFTPLILLFAPINIIQSKISQTSLVEFILKKGFKDENC